MPAFGPILRRFAAVALALLACAPALADDLPGRVGRLAETGGRVYLATEQRAEDWLDAQRNDTVTSGDNLWVSGDGRAEIDYGGGQVRLAGDTNVHVARLDDTVLALFVAQGRVVVRVRVLEPGEAARIDTPNTQIALTRPGLYRIDASPDRTRTEVVVREGEATVSFAAGLQQVLPGQTAEAAGADPVRIDVRNGYYVDAFDAWSAERDRRYERSRSATYVSRQMIGYADLDEHGRWETSTEYGAVWYPSSVAPDWAPYRYGRWSWVGAWGWTWVDDAPWGYAPFHYGRWVYWRGRWAWAPGGVVVRPVWSPAMVAWYGGAGWSYSVSFGAPVYGWVPLAWGEPFLPWWGGCSHRCWTHYNRPYAVNLAERPNAPPTRYANWSAPGGVTAVPGAIFTGRRPVHGHVVDVKPYVRNAPMLAEAPRAERPVPGRTFDVRVPERAPLPAAAVQTKPMRLPPPATQAVPGRSTEMPVARPPSGRAAPPTGTASAPPAVAPGVRGPAQASSAPGTWGATTQPGSPSGVRPAPREASSPPSYAPAQRGPSPERSAPPASGQRAGPPPSVQPSMPVVPRSAPPSSPAGPAVVPSAPPPPSSGRAGPPSSAPPGAPPASAPAGGRAGPPSPSHDGGGRGDGRGGDAAPPARMPKDMQR